MKNITGFLALVATLFLIAGCENGGGTTVEGTASGTESLVFMEMGGESPDTLKTVEVGSDGKFSYDLQVDTLTMIFLYATEEYAAPLFVQPGENVKLEINVDETNPDYQVSGSPESERVKKITDILGEAMDKVDSLNAIVEEQQDREDFMQTKAKLNAEFQSIVQRTGQRYKEMIDEKPGSIANIFIFSQSIGNVPMISVQEDFEYLEKVADGVRENYPDAKITQTFVGRVEEMKQQLASQKQMEQVQQSVGAGSEVPEISLPNPEGETMNLSDLRGKVVLVDFWAAWCRPCRMENPNLVRMYEQYKDQGFEIFSVSLDGLPNQQNPKQAWVNAIEQDNLTWDHHVSDLRGWNSSVVPKFGFQGIPYTVLVDRDGKIIQTQLRGPQLEAKLQEVLGGA